MASAAKILRIMNPPGQAFTAETLQRVHVGIYDYLDQLAALTFSLSNSPTTIVTGSGTGSVTVPSAPADAASSEFPAAEYIMVPGAGGISQLVGDVLAGPGLGVQSAQVVQMQPAALALGSLLFTAVAAPSSPSSGFGAVYFDSTSLNLAVKTSAGTVKHGVQTRTATASNWIRSIADDGSTTISQPAFTDISGSVTLSQLGSGAALSVLGNPNSVSGTRSDIAASSGSDFPLRERSGALGFGTLATAAYGNNTVTYGKLQTTTAGKVMLGRDVGAGTVGEIGIDSSLAITSGILGVVGWQQFTLTYGGDLGGVYSSLPAFLGVGDNAYSGTTTLGFRAPVASGQQDWGYQVASNSLVPTGSGISVNFNLYVNGVNQGTIFNVNLGSSGGSITSTFASIAAGALVSVHMEAAGGTVTGGSITAYLVARCRT